MDHGETSWGVRGTATVTMYSDECVCDIAGSPHGRGMRRNNVASQLIVETNINIIFPGSCMRPLAH
eukprot:4537576-Pyramimonas_sp.AAC.1